MKLERISQNQIKYSISFEELSYKGFIQDDLLKESFIWDALFDEMLDEASRMYELEDCGAVSIEIFSLTSKELVLILTLDEEDMIEPSSEDVKKPVKAESENIIVMAADIDHIIMLVKYLIQIKHENILSSLYVLNSNYYLTIEKNGFNQNALYGLCEEYGTIDPISLELLEDYGKPLIEKNALQTLHHYF
ncbi:adaptor protein MecA [Lederbergia citrea]|uniref:adaptor protein MecA n=1 Tax=Lederbergia citrea TaxID=2833581 RepID=UPI001BC97974|nr:adaptor protein MecA [Lederbergia citrea]MBS4176542.1 adaptor protein MecA [Lederbergia citrea]